MGVGCDSWCEPLTLPCLESSGRQTSGHVPGGLSLLHSLRWKDLHIVGDISLLPTPPPDYVSEKERELNAPCPLHPDHGWDMTSCFQIFAKTKHNLELWAKQVISLLSSSYWGMLSQQWKKKLRQTPGPSWGSRICWRLEDSERGLERVQLGSR